MIVIAAVSISVSGQASHTALSARLVPPLLAVKFPDQTYWHSRDFQQLKNWHHLHFSQKCMAFRRFNYLLFYFEFQVRPLLALTSIVIDLAEMSHL